MPPTHSPQLMIHSTRRIVGAAVRCVVRILLFLIRCTTHMKYSALCKLYIFATSPSSPVVADWLLSWMENVRRDGFYQRVDCVKWGRMTSPSRILYCISILSHPYQAHAHTLCRRERVGEMADNNNTTYTYSANILHESRSREFFAVNSRYP